MAFLKASGLSTPMPSESQLNQLHDLEVRLGYSKEKVRQYSHFGATEVSVEAFLMRFLRSAEDTEDAAAKLSSRRIFERTLPSLSITPGIVAALRSGAFSILGRDSSNRVVLCISMQLLTMPNLEMDEAQRLIIILMEYMQFLAVSGAPSTTPANQNRNNNNNNNRARAESNAQSYNQQFTLVVNEEHAQWYSHQTLLSKTNNILTIFSKYYPGLIGQVLVIGAPFDARESIRKSLENSTSTEVKNVIHFIQRSSLTQYMPRSAIPLELGGGNRESANGMELAESVLRQWYTLTAFLMEEAVAKDGTPVSSQRPLFILPPQRNVLSSAVHMLAAGGPRRSIFSPTSRENSLTHYPGDDDDDGLCSAITDGLESPSCERTEAFLHQRDEVDAESQIQLTREQLIKAYRLECAMRKAAEQRLHIAQQHLELDPRNATTIEKTLTSIHRDVNTLIAEVLTRARASSNGKQSNPPSLRQLIDLTIAAINVSAGTTAPIPAMTPAAPVQRDPKDDGCCCCS